MVGLPAMAAWCHLDAPAGFEVLFPRREADGYRLEGHVTAVEDGAAWSIRYALTLDTRWRSRYTHVVGQSTSGVREVRLESTGDGTWSIDGTPAPRLEACFDVDLEASACTNALPVNRLGLRVGQAAAAPAVYVRALDLGVERLEQQYTRLPSDEHSRYAYVSPAFDFEAELVFDRAGLVIDYPGIAVRVA